MAAGFLISRILLLCLISDVNRSFAFPRAQHKGGRKQMQNYGNRRPLDYIWHLRQPLHSFGQVRTREHPKKKSFLSRLSFPVMQAQALSSHGSRLMSLFQHAQQKNQPLVQPRSFQINVGLPFLKLDEQNEKIEYIPDFDTEPAHGPSTVQMQGGSNTPKFVPEKTVFAKDPYQRKSGEVSKSTILFNFSIPLPATSLQPLKTTIHVQKPQTPLSMYERNKYAEPAKQDQSSIQTESKWPSFNQAPQQPSQTGSQWPTYNHPNQEQSQTGAKWPTDNQATQELSQTGSQWPSYNQATQEPVQTGSQWSTYNQATEQSQTGSQWPTYNQVTQEQSQTGSQWPTYSQATQEQSQTGSQWPTYSQATQEQSQTGSQWPTYSQATQEQSQTGSQWPSYSQPTQEQSQTGSQWPSYNQATQEQSQTGSQWPTYNQATQEQSQTGSQWPSYSQATQEQSQTGSQWPSYSQATQEQSQTGSQWPTYNPMIQQSQTESQWPTYNRMTEEQSQTGSQWPTYNQAAQEVTQTESKRPSFNQVTQQQSQTGSQWPTYNQPNQEQSQTGVKWSNKNPATQQQSQKGPKRPTYNQVSQEQSQTGSKWSTNNRATQEQSQTGFKWPTIHQSKHGKTQKQTGSKLSFFSQAGTSPQKETYEAAYKEPSNKPARIVQSNQYKNTGQVNLEKPAKQPWGLQMQSMKKPLPILKYFENLDFHRPQTSLSKDGNRDFVIKPDLSKLHLSPPLQFGSNPSNAEIESGFGNSGTDVKEESMEQGEKDQKVSTPVIKLDFTFPVLGKLPNITQSNGGYVLNIKPENTGSFAEVAKSPQSGSKWPILSFEAVQQKPNEQTEKQWPHLNFDTILQQNKQPEPVHTPPTSGKQSFWNSNQQVNQDKTSSGQSWGFLTSEMNKLQSPVLPVSKYQELINPERTSKDKGQTVQPNPSQPEAVQSQRYTWSKPGSDDNQGQIRHSGSRLTFTIKHDDLFKTPVEPLQTAKTEHPSFNFQSVDFSKMDASPANSYEAKKPQKWQKPIFPNLHPYNSGQETSGTWQSPFSQSISYENPKESPGQDTEHNLDRRGKYVKLSITADGAADVVDGQNSFPSHSSHNEYPGKWDAAETPLNLQSSSCESSSSNSEQDSFKGPFNPPYQNKPQSEMSNVARKPPKFDQSYNIQVNYSPSAEKTVVSVPSNAFQHVLSGSVSRPIQSLFHSVHNNDQRQQSASYNQPQNLVSVRSSRQ